MPKVTIPTEIVPPFHVVPMPINVDGEGPEMDPTKVVKTMYEVWDSLNQTIGEFNAIEFANIAVNSLNNLYLE